MSRPFRLLALSTVLAVSASLLPIAGAAGAAPPAARPSPRPAAGAASGITVGTTTVSSDVFVPVGPAAPRAARWPIGGGGADLTAHTVTPTGQPAQRLAAVQMRHYRVYGGVMEARVRLGGTPDASTSAYVLLAFGRLDAARTTCSSPAGSNIAFTSTDTDTTSANPVYRGSTIEVQPVRLAAARRATWNCAFARTASDTSFVPPAQYDGLAGAAALFRQKPLLSIRVKGRRLKAHGYTRVPVIIRNSSDTVATAPRVRLRVRTRGVAVRYNARVGTIRPGRAARGAIFVKDTRRGTGYVTLIVSSKDYRRKVTVKVREVR
jgi:hypothetical protein